MELRIDVDDILHSNQLMCVNNYVYKVGVCYTFQSLLILCLLILCMLILWFILNIVYKCKHLWLCGVDNYNWI